MSETLVRKVKLIIVLCPHASRLFAYLLILDGHQVGIVGIESAQSTQRLRVRITKLDVDVYQRS